MAYDQYFGEQNRKVADRLAQLYSKLGYTASEVDWAFFLDRGTQYTTDLSLAEAALRKLDPKATPAQRRLAISRASRPSVGGEQLRLRVGRDMAFIVGSLGRTALTDEEYDDWQYVGGFTAEQLDLDDSRTISANPF
jgi:hypothetical protein